MLKHNCPEMLTQKLEIDRRVMHSAMEAFQDVLSAKFSHHQTTRSPLIPSMHFCISVVVSSAPPPGDSPSLINQQASVSRFLNNSHRLILDSNLTRSEKTFLLLHLRRIILTKSRET